MNCEKVGFNGVVKSNSYQSCKIRSGTKDHVGVSMSPRNDNMFLWLDNDLYYQNNEGRLFIIDFIEIPIKNKIEEQVL